jgi:hypothetical protein
MRVAHALQRIAGVRLAAVLYRAFGPENQLASGSEKRGADRQHVRTRLERLTFSTQFQWVKLIRHSSFPLNSNIDSLYSGQYD